MSDINDQYNHDTSDILVVDPTKAKEVRTHDSKIVSLEEQISTLANESQRLRRDITRLKDQISDLAGVVAGITRRK